MVPWSGPESPVMCQVLNFLVQQKQGEKSSRSTNITPSRTVLLGSALMRTRLMHMQEWNVEGRTRLLFGIWGQLGNFSKELRKDSGALCTADKKALKSYRWRSDLYVAVSSSNIVLFISMKAFNTLYTSATIALWGREENVLLVFHSRALNRKTGHFWQIWVSFSSVIQKILEVFL